MSDTITTTGPQRYRVIRAEIEALQWTGENYEEMEAFAGSAFSCHEGAAELLGNPGGAWHPLYEGNYAVRGVTGEFFIIAKEDFPDNYEPIPAADDEWRAVATDTSGLVVDILSPVLPAPELNRYGTWWITVPGTRLDVAPDGSVRDGRGRYVATSRGEWLRIAGIANQIVAGFEDGHDDH